MTAEAENLVFKEHFIGEDKVTYYQWVDAICVDCGTKIISNCVQVYRTPDDDRRIAELGKHRLCADCKAKHEIKDLFSYFANHIAGDYDQNDGQELVAASNLVTAFVMMRRMK